MTKPKSQAELINALKSILNNNQTIGTQEALCAALAEQGHIVTQSSLSRLLRRMGVIKVSNKRGQSIYSLSQAPQKPTSPPHIASLISEIKHNETVVVITTNPGCAQLIASILDHHKPGNLLGTVAGDDTVVVIPASIKQVAETHKAVERLLFQ